MTGLITLGSACGPIKRSREAEWHSALTRGDAPSIRPPAAPRARPACRTRHRRRSAQSSQRKLRRARTGGWESSGPASQLLQNPPISSTCREQHPGQAPQEHNQHAQDDQAPWRYAVEVAELGPGDDCADVEEDGLRVSSTRRTSRTAATASGRTELSS